MADKPRFLLNGGLDVTRTSILQAANGDVVHPSQVKPRYIPLEPYKAAAHRQEKCSVTTEGSCVEVGSCDHHSSEAAADQGLLKAEVAASLWHQAAQDSRSKPVNVVDPMMSSGLTKEGGSADDGRIRTDCSSFPADRHHPDTALSASHGDVPSRADLLAKLDKQLQINSELKRLLVASLGSDLEAKLERLTEDRVKLASAVGEYSRRRVEDYEDLDLMSIQADLWRSKYLATRLLADELSKERNDLNGKYAVTVEALRDLLQEHRTVLDTLQAIDRSLEERSHQSVGHQATAQHRESPAKNAGHAASQGTPIAALAEKVLGSIDDLCRQHHGYPARTAGGVAQSAQVYYSSAEQKAFQVLRDSPTAMGSSVMRPLSAPEAVPRFHKFVRYEGYMCARCQKCTGEVKII